MVSSSVGHIALPQFRCQAVREKFDAAAEHDLDAKKFRPDQKAN
jgi:hypothetical protein